MDYRAVLTLDYTGATDANARSRLLKALQHAGWSYAETSAMHIECASIQPVLLGLEVLARYVNAPGDLSACTITIQLVGEDKDAPGAMTPVNAFMAVMDGELPSEQGG